MLSSPATGPSAELIRYPHGSTRIGRTCMPYVTPMSSVTPGSVHPRMGRTFFLACMNGSCSTSPEQVSAKGRPASGRGCGTRRPCQVLDARYLAGSLSDPTRYLISFRCRRDEPHARGVQGNARLAEPSVAEETAAALDATDKDVAIGGAGLAAAAIELGLVDELRTFRNPIVVDGGTPFLPPVTEDVLLDLIETRTFGSRVIYESYGRAPG